MCLRFVYTSKALLFYGHFFFFPKSDNDVIPSRQSKEAGHGSSWGTGGDHQVL